MLPVRNPNFDEFIAPARLKPQLWRLLLGVLIIGVVYFGLALLMFGIAWVLDGSDGVSYVVSGLMGEGAQAQTLLLFLTFIGLSAGAFLASRLLHKRSPATLFGADRRRFVRHFLVALALIAIIYLPTLIVASFMYPPIQNLPLASWLVWLPAALVVLFIQISAEEIVFRGYLQQQLAARFASRWIWWVLPSLIFAALHYNPAESGSNTWLILAHTFLFGLIAADLTCRTGSLGAAMGFHFANNMYALLLISLDGPLTGFSLFVTPFSASDTEVLTRLLMIDFALMLTGYLIYMRIMSRRGF